MFSCRRYGTVFSRSDDYEAVLRQGSSRCRSASWRLGLVAPSAPFRAGITDRAAGKLAPRYYGPYLVLERIGDVAYRLQLPTRAKIHNVFHAVFLKKHQGDPPATMVPLPPVVHGRVVPTPDSVKRACLNRGIWELCVRWVGRDSSDSTWEPLDEFKATYPEFQLEDELFRKEGGNVVDAFVGIQYRRKKKGKAADPSSSG